MNEHNYFSISLQSLYLISLFLIFAHLRGKNGSHCHVFSDNIAHSANYIYVKNSFSNILSQRLSPLKI